MFLRHLTIFKLICFKLICFPNALYFFEDESKHLEYKYFYYFKEENKTLDTYSFSSKLLNL